MGLIVEGAPQQQISQEESALIDLLKSHGFQQYTDSASATAAVSMRVDMTPSAWYYANPDEKIACYKTKNILYKGFQYEERINLSRPTLLVKNKKYFAANSIFPGSPQLSEPTNVSMPNYSFKFPLEGEDVSEYETAIKTYVTNFAPIKDLQSVDEETFQKELENIKFNFFPTPLRKELTSMAQNLINQSRGQLKDLPLDKQGEYEQKIEDLIKYGKDRGYNIS